jgi:uncharacterized protein
MPQYNVSALLKESVGAAREYDFDEELSAEGGAVRLRGSARFIRTKAGVLVQAHAEGKANLSCSRCLEPVTVPLAFDLEEEYLQTVDVNTGARLPVAPSADNFRIDARHTLDLGEALRQYWQMAQPMAPLCRPGCAGMCPHCGARLAGEEHACSAPPLDERWSKLLDFRP